MSEGGTRVDTVVEDDSFEGRIEPEIEIANFRIKRLLGEGATGVVYLAQDLTLGRRVALKIAKTRVSGEARARFLDEARTTAALSHPNIVTIHAFGEHRGRPFLALEFVDGESLRARLAAGPMHERDALRVVRAIAEGIAEAHRQGLVHADLKPENVVIAADGRVRIVDFGLARLLGSNGGSASGTPAYMAPERWLGAAPSASLDVWALGVILCELIVGFDPYGAEDIARSAFAGTPLPPPRLPDARWAELAARCLAWRPEERPPADELAARIGVLLEPAAASVAHGRSPFPGLRAFTAADADNYFGRQADIDAAVEALRARPLVPVCGPSGIGKSSFVVAGVAPRLREASAWTVIVCRPGAVPFASLADALGHADPAALAAHPTVLALLLDALARRTATQVLLVIDQFEELFTLAPDAASDFCACIGAAANADEPWRIMLTIRDDHLGRLATSPALAAHLGAVVGLAPMTRLDLEAAVLVPLRRARYDVDDAKLPSRIAEDVDGQLAALPLLQLACQLLWERRDLARRLVLCREYAAMGGAAGALVSRAERLLSVLTPEEVRAVRTVLLRLVDQDGLRRPRPLAELLEQLPAETRRVVDALLAERLLVVRRDPGNETALVEIAHESLAALWPQLRRWLDETHQERALVTELHEAAQLWLRRGARDDETWVGAALDEAVRRVAEWGVTLPSAARHFLDAGVQRARRLRRRRAAAIGALGLVATAAILAALAFATKEREARRQQEQIRMAAADLGRFELRLEPFDWDEEAQRASPPRQLPPLRWSLRAPRIGDLDAPGRPYGASDLRRGIPQASGGAIVEIVEARSGPAVLEIDGRGGACAPSHVRLLRLPGYAERNAALQVLRIPVPTCQATAAGTAQVDAGAFIANVDTPSGSVVVDVVTWLPEFAIDRTEVTRGAFAVYAALESQTGDAVAHTSYLDIDKPGTERLPVVGVSLATATRYCAFLGKELPTAEEWQKAFRGGLEVDGALNPAPARTAVWLAATSPFPTNIKANGDGFWGVAPVGSFRDDVSPYGVVDLGGNVSEWSASGAVPTRWRGLRTVLGGNWDTPPGLGHELVTWRNSRAERYLDFTIGFRCVSRRPRA